MQNWKHFTWYLRLPYHELMFICIQSSQSQMQSAEKENKQSSAFPRWYWQCNWWLFSRHYSSECQPCLFPTHVKWTQPCLAPLHNSSQSHTRMCVCRNGWFSHTVESELLTQPPIGKKVLLSDHSVRRPKFCLTGTRLSTVLRDSDRFFQCWQDGGIVHSKIWADHVGARDLVKGSRSFWVAPRQA